MSQSNGNGSGNVRVEIYDQTYHLRGSDPEYIAQLAQYVDNKMRLISQQAATVDSLRVAVLANAPWLVEKTNWRVTDPQAGAGGAEYRRRTARAATQVRVRRQRLQRAGRTSGGRAG